MQDFYDAIKHLADGQVYALIAPSESTYPFIVYTPVSGEQILGINGLHGLERIRVQVDCYAKTYVEALGLQDEVLLAILAAKNTVSDVRMVLTDFESETRSYRVSVDYTYHR